MKQALILISLMVFTITIGYAQKGKDGAKIINVNNTVVNEYTSLAADAAVGSTSIKVESNSLNANNHFPSALSSGDLVMIIQLQGALISAKKDSSWGSIINYENCGQNEWAQVTGVSGSKTINLQCPLQNNYTANGKVQIIRVPRYSSLGVNAGDTLTCDAWNGSTGGILAAEISGNTTISTGGVIDVSGKGFRGGIVQNQIVWVWGVFSYASFSEDTGGIKGESIAGYENDYAKYGGMYGRGAPANGGGGGNSTNAPGGGGGNAGNINAWTGKGNPDISNSSWIAAWNLEYNGFANSTSSGGGRGGYACSTAYANPLVIPPGNHAWGTSPWAYRDNEGGVGGRPLDYSTGRLFMGGGGGAGQENDDYGGNGGNSGGLVYLLSYGTISGNGVVSSNGQNGQNETSEFVDGDGAGGGGSGGTIVLNSLGNISGIDVFANGGNGGNQIITNSPEEAEGGAGGGGGGYIAISTGSITLQASGGKNGTTTSGSLAAFPPNGGTKGGTGITNGTIISVSPSSIVINPGPEITICNGASITLHAIGGDSIFTTYNWSPSAGLSNTNSNHTVASPSVTTTYTLITSNTSCPGEAIEIITVIPNVIINPAPDASICLGDAVLLSAVDTGANSYLWSPSSGLSCTSCENPLASPSATTKYTVIASNSYCSNTASTTVNVLNGGRGGVIKALRDTICQGTDGILTLLSDSSGGTIQWQSSTTENNFMDITNATATSYKTTPLYQSTFYRVKSDNGLCPALSDTFELIVQPPLVAYFSFGAPGTGNVVTFNSDSSKGAIVRYDWSFGDGTNSDSANPTHTYAKDSTYYACLTLFDGSSCSYTYCSYVSPETGISPVSLNDSWTIYPNPFSSDLTICRNNTTEPMASIEIYDMLGRLMMNVYPEAGSTPISLNVSALAKGMYYIKITTANLSHVQKLVKQ